MKPRLFIEQKLTAFINLYKVFSETQDDEQGEMVAFAQQKRLAFKEKVRFYDDEKKSHETFSFRAEKVIDVHGRYIVEDDKGAVIGMFRKDFKSSLLNSTWILMDEKGNDMFRIYESSVSVAVFRRFAGWLPVVGELLEIALNMLKYHFVIAHAGTGQVIGNYSKTTRFRDHYTLSMTDEAYGVCDWRALAALSVALDALQSR